MVQALPVHGAVYNAMAACDGTCDYSGSFAGGGLPDCGAASPAGRQVVAVAIHDAQAATGDDDDDATVLR